MRDAARAGAAAATLAVTGVGDNRSFVLTLFDSKGQPNGHAKLGRRAFDRLLQAARDVAPTGAGFGEITVTFELSEEMAHVG